MRILALVPGGIGDQILFFPTLEDLKRSYPDVEIDVVVEPRAKEAYRLFSGVAQVIPFDFKDRNGLADWGNLLGQVRDRYADAVLSLGQSWGVSFFLWLTGIPIRVGYDATALSRSFLTHPVPVKPQQYAARMYHDLLQGLGIGTSCPDLAINVPKKDIAWAEAEQQKLGLAARDYVLIHGGSSQLARDKGIDKLYPVANWQAIVQDFQRRQPDLPLVVVQGPEDAVLVTGLLQACPELKVTRPDNLGQLAALIAGANLMLCTDSAPMHLAVAVQTYTLALFGPTDPAKLLPRSDKFVGIQSPTGSMADISPATVLAKIWEG